MRSTLVAAVLFAVLFMVAGCATGIGADAAPPMPRGERSELAPQAGSGGM